VENSVFAVTANRCGEDRRPQGSLRFTGRSQVAGPRGQRLFQAPAARETVHVEPLDLAQARNKNLTRRNHVLRDRRPDLYFTT
jgi:predicted amidohydrolase